MIIIKAVKGRKEQRGKYVVTVLVDEAELDALDVPNQEMKMAVSDSRVVDEKPVRPRATLDKEASKWLKAYRTMEGEDLFKS